MAPIFVLSHRRSELLDSYANAPEVWSAVSAKLTAKKDLVVAVDGPDCSGKTTLATTLKETAQIHGFECTVCHLDDTFERIVRRPRRNPDAVSEFVLEFFSYERISEIIGETSGLRIFEGMFLLRPNLLPMFDFKIRLELDEQSVFDRAITRDRADFENWGDLALHYIGQTLPAQRLYRWFCQPSSVADLTIFLSDNQNNRDVVF